jgi:hypothetical protein
MKRYRTKKVTAAAKKTTRIRKRPPKLWIPNSKTPDDLPSEVTTPQNKTNSDWEGVFFKPDEFQIFKDAHAIAEKLVFDVKRPYAKKLISLATYGIDRFNRFNTKEGEAYTGTAEEVISKAWNTVVFAWETKTSTAITEKRACAFAQTYEEDGKAKPLMAFSESFRLKNPQRGFLATQRGKLVATAFFLRRLSMNFCTLCIDIHTLCSGKHGKASPPQNIHHPLEDKPKLESTTRKKIREDKCSLNNHSSHFEKGNMNSTSCSKISTGS